MNPHLITETIETRDEAEGDLAAAETLGTVTINHATHGDITITYLADVDEFTIETDETNLRHRANDCAAVDLLVELYEG